MASAITPTHAEAAGKATKIRVALIGLNAPFKPGESTGTSWAAVAHLPYLQQSEKYELVALQNSSAKRAQDAIAAYGLDNTKVKAYGLPDDVANDPDIDLVVSSIRVDRHAQSVVPSIKAQKAVFVEWPLEASYFLAQELADLASEKKVKSVIGLQGRYHPAVTKVKELIESGTIGQIEGSTVVARHFGGPSITTNVDYFLDRAVGGNTMTILLGHILGFTLPVLGRIKSSNSLLINQYPLADLIDEDGNVVATKENNVPNQIMLNAILQSGAGLTLALHSGPRPPKGASDTPARRVTSNSLLKDFPALDWRVFGSEGEIKITSHDLNMLNAGGEGITVEYVNETNSGHLVKVDLEDDFEHLPAPARNMARLYEAFAGVGSHYPNFEYATQVHEIIEKMWEDYDKTQQH